MSNIIAGAVTGVLVVVLIRVLKLKKWSHIIMLAVGVGLLAGIISAWLQ